MTSSVPRYSNAKHWCPLCRTFIQNDPKSIRAHEQGLRHLGVVKRQLAQAARAKDIATHQSAASTARRPPSSLPPPPQFNEDDVVQKPVEVASDEVLGQYVVRKVVYFQGEYHEDLLLLPSSSVQLSLVDEEGNPGAWIPCQVNSFNPMEKTYAVSFKAEDDSEASSVDVEARDLRIIGPQPPASVSNWVQVAQQPEVEEEVADVEQADDVDTKPTVEFYKGVALVEEDAMPGFVERKDEGEGTGEKKNVTFRKRIRPGAAS